MAALTRKQVEKALRDAEGNVSEAARVLGVSRNGVYYHVKRSVRLQEVLADSRETMVDEAEKALREMIKDHHPAAVIFALKTIGKDRGYIEKQTIDLTSGGQPLKSYVGISPDDWDDDQAAT